MGIKKLSIIALMIIFILILTTKVNSAENIEENSQYTINQSIKLKALPIIYSIEKSEIQSGSITITEILNDWCKIENTEESGWVRINTLKQATTEINTAPENTEPTTNPEEETPNTESTESNQENEEQEENNTQSTSTGEVTEISKTGYVSSDGLNIRTEPNTSSEIIHSLSFNARVTITGEIDNWYRINYEDQVGYVSKKYISETRLPETTSRGGIDRTATLSSTETSTNMQEETTTNVAESEQTNTKQESSSNTKVSGTQIVEFAKQYIGYKYTAGGATPATGFDCSGFTSYVFKHFGITLSRSSKGQINNGVAVNSNDLQLGDLLIYKNESKTAIGHVGIYIGNRSFIHSANKKEGVKITSTSASYYSQRYVGARRVI